MTSGILEKRLGSISSRIDRGPSSQEKALPSFVSSLLAIAQGQLACVAVAALTQLCIARLLGPSLQGLISLSLMSIAFGALIGSLGSEATIIVWVSKSKGSLSSWFPAVMFWVFSGSLLSSSLWALLYWKWNPTFLKGLTPGLAFWVLSAIPLAVLFSVAMALLVGEERFRLRSLIALVNRVTALAVFLICFVLFGHRAETAVVGYLAGLAVAICIALVFLRHFFLDAWKLGEARQSLLPTMKFGARAQAGNMVTFFSYRFDVFIVNYFLDASHVGLYSLGVLVSEVLWQLPAVVATALCPRTARTVGAGADSFTCMIVRQVFILTLVAGLAIAFASPFAIPFIFGARFAPSVPVIWWILPGTIVFSLGKVIGADLTGREMNSHMVISSFVGFVFTLLLDLFLIPRMGIQGAALASSIAYFAGGGYLLIVIKRELKAPWRSLFLPSLADLTAYVRLWQQLRTRFWP